MNLSEQLKAFIVENFLFGQSNSLDYDTDFFEKGIIDSTGIVELISFVEMTFNFTILDEELTLENFSSINKLTGFINRKLIQLQKTT
jgi:acyl carrier protein